MKEVKIYTIVSDQLSPPITGESFCTDMVRHSDYADLEEKCAALAAENAGLKELIEQHANSVAVCPNCSHEEPSETDDIVALYRSMETPATDAFLAEVRAQGVELFAESQKEYVRKNRN
ncbi:TPA: endonuclease, partial [Salmonella enterica subsp. enterica serovar Muenster]|nr:endonuclease [Salmonella enterica subsp. enterica serovar Muenster]